MVKTSKSMASDADYGNQMATTNSGTLRGDVDAALGD
jgi:hypothetical protein